MINVRSVKWRCRRGMLELDLFLQPFFENCYSSLNYNEKIDFIDLLEESDVDLFQWLMVKSESEVSRFNHLIILIRSYRLGKLC